MKPLLHLGIALLASSAAGCSSPTSVVTCANDNECLVGQVCDRTSKTCRDARADSGPSLGPDASAPPRVDAGPCTTLLCSGVCCAANQRCVGGACQAACSCTNRDCGDDGCGTSCGVCPGGWICDSAGTCVGEPPDAGP
ncbi:MAG TPA: hypothetical protein VGK67_35540 [Myxococcales bacterium]